MALATLTKESILTQITFKKLLTIFLYVIIPASLFYVISFVIMKLSGFSSAQILREPAQITHSSSFFGFLSNIGNFIWVSSFAICFFAFFTQGNSLTKQHKQLLLLTGVFAVLLCIDDFFMVHDRYIMQEICYATYLICALTLLVGFFDLITKIELLGFLLAGLFLGLSIFTDLTQHLYPVLHGITQTFEEGFKFIGIVSWLYFSIRISSYRANETPEVENV